MKEVKVMAGRGRPPKPTAVKELEGNPGKRPLNKNVEWQHFSRQKL